MKPRKKNLDTNVKKSRKEVQEASESDQLEMESGNEDSDESDAQDGEVAENSDADDVEESDANAADSDDTDGGDEAESDGDKELKGDGEPTAKKPRLSKTNLYQPPTNEELQELKETENLFQSSLFRMQISELLNEVKLKEKHRKIADDFIKKFCDVLLNLPRLEERDITEQTFLEKKKVKVPFHQQPFNVKGKFKFLPPKSVKTIGSYLTGTSAKPDPNINIALEIPKECFQAKDHLNQRYLRKRALYLACLVVGLKDCSLVEEMLYCHHHSGHLSPILIVKPAGKCGKHFTVHVHLYPEESSFKLSRFHIGKNNLRHKWYAGQEEVDERQDCEQSSTPYYNSAVLGDLTLMKQTQVLHNSIADPAIQDGLLLLKVWLRQRQLSSVCGGFSNFLMTAYVCYLLKKRKLNRLMSSYQIVRNTLIHLSQASWDTQGITLEENSMDPNKPGLEDFHKDFDVVFVDSTGCLNLTANLNITTFERVKHEAKLGIEHLETLGIDGFEALFMTPMPFLTKFDQLFHLYNVSKLSEKVASENLDSMMDHGGDYVRVAIARILQLVRQALGNRIHLFQLQPPALAQWTCENDVPNFDHMGYISVGLLLNADNCNSSLDKGPAADSSEAKAFRDFWGEKSELRRFQDSSILEAVVWPAKLLSQKRKITCKIVKHILNKHMGVARDTVIFVGSQLDDLLQLRQPHRKKTLLYGTGEEQHADVIKVYDQLCKQLRGLKDLPLAINSIQTVSPALRYTQVFPPLRALDDEPVEVIGIRQVPQPDQPCPLYNPAITVQCVLEQSGKWPDDAEAVRRLKAGFHIQLAQCLREELDLLALPYPSHVTVLKSGLVFNIEIGYLKEISLLRLVKTTEGMVRSVDNEEARALERHLVIKPKLSSAIHGVQTQCCSYSSAVRLVKRWVSAHMLSDHISEEALELVTAYVFLHTAPYTPPGSPLVGFLRVLRFFASFDWKLFPLIVNLNQELKKEDYSTIQSHFTKHRQTLPLMYIATPYDKLNSLWTRQKPSPAILQRLTILAHESVELLQKQLCSTDIKTDFKQVFRPPLDVYDVLIELKPLQLSRCHQAIDVHQSIPPPAYLPIDFTTTDSQKLTLPVINYDPALLYLQELREAYDELAAFFYDPLGGSVIGVIWKPKAFQADDFKVSHVAARMPKLNEKAVQLIPNMEAIIEDFKTLGYGLVNHIQSKSVKTNS